MNSNFSAAVVFGEDFPADYTEWLPKRNPYDRRRAGVLLHPTSFPGPYGIGDLGDQAFRFLDWLNHSGCSLWQSEYMGSEIEIVDRIVYKNKNQHQRCSYFQYLLKVRRDLRLLQSAHIEEIVSSSFQVIHGTKPKQKVQLLESTAKAMEHKKLRVCVDSAMELMNEVNVAVMTRTYPEDSGERKELILLQNIASYMLLACGAVYLISQIANNQPGCVRGVLHALGYHHWHYNVKKLLPHKKHNGPRHVKGFAFGMFIPDACVDKIKKKGWNLWIDGGKNVVRRGNIGAAVRRVMDGGDDDKEG
ncbi:unnamed protein product [Camellia sinensis]